MPQIYVDTDHSNHNKLYIADKAGNYAADAVKAIQKAVKQVITGDAGFTTVKAKKGYRIRLKLSTYAVAKGETSCTVSGEILRVSPTKTKDGKTGEAIVSTGMSAAARVPGTGKGALIQCVDALAERLASDSLPHISKDAGS